jgi:hypothetical protein
MSAPAQTYDITADQGATYSVVITYKNSNGTPINLTNYTARMQLRASYASAAAALTLTTENGRIVLGGALGTITLTVAASTMETLEAKTYVYDLELVDGSTVIRLLQGLFVNRPNVTK